MTPIMVCCKHARSVDPIRLLLSWGADVNLVDDLGNSAAHIAVEANNISAVLLLEDAKVDWKILNKRGLFPYEVSLSAFIR